MCVGSSSTVHLHLTPSTPVAQGPALDITRERARRTAAPPRGRDDSRAHALDRSHTDTTRANMGLTSRVMIRACS